HPVTQTVNVGGGGNPVQAPFAYDFSVQSINGVAHGYIFTATLIGSSANAASSFNWDFGDGHTCIACAATEAHVYADAKTYTVTLSIPGQTGSAQHPSVPTSSRHRGVHH
ncbi:MAG TPA: PKD domain-containing protein, partial [Thermoanaerobaculia bacterium]|nr:PKD domain-containing protein [Thermoanaerobaculia bacterium]